MSLIKHTCILILSLCVSAGTVVIPAKADIDMAVALASNSKQEVNEALQVLKEQPALAERYSSELLLLLTTKDHTTLSNALDTFKAMETKPSDLVTVIYDEHDACTKAISEIESIPKRFELGRICELLKSSVNELYTLQMRRSSRGSSRMMGTPRLSDKEMRALKPLVHALQTVAEQENADRFIELTSILLSARYSTATFVELLTTATENPNPRIRAYSKNMLQQTAWLKKQAGASFYAKFLTNSVNKQERISAWESLYTDFFRLSSEHLLLLQDTFPELQSELFQDNLCQSEIDLPFLMLKFLNAEDNTVETFRNVFSQTPPSTNCLCHLYGIPNKGAQDRLYSLLVDALNTEPTLLNQTLESYFFCAVDLGLSATNMHDLFKLCGSEQQRNRELASSIMSRLTWPAQRKVLDLIEEEQKIGGTNSAYSDFLLENPRFFRKKQKLYLALLGAEEQASRIKALRLFLKLRREPRSTLQYILALERNLLSEEPVEQALAKEALFKIKNLSRLKSKSDSVRAFARRMLNSEDEEIRAWVSKHFPPSQ